MHVLGGYEEDKGNKPIFCTLFVDNFIIIIKYYSNTNVCMIEPWRMNLEMQQFLLRKLEHKEEAMNILLAVFM